MPCYAICYAIYQVDLSELVRRTDARIDAPVHGLLRDGTIRLLRCGWVLDAMSDRCATMGRRQELPAAALLPPAEAAALFSAGSRRVLVLSYPWLTAAHPDPAGATLAAVRRYLEAPS